MDAEEDARELLARTAELPGSKRDLLVVLTQYRHALFNLMHAIAGSTDLAAPTEPGGAAEGRLCSSRRDHETKRAFARPAGYGGVGGADAGRPGARTGPPPVPAAQP